jgi:hypothetical protein
MIAGPVDWTVRTEGTEVQWVVNGRAFVVGPWKMFLEVYQAMRRLLDGVTEKATVGPLVFHREIEDDVAITRGGSLVCRIPIRAFRRIAAATLQQTKRAEEREPKVAEHLVEQNALLLRAGAPFGLTSTPMLKAATLREAATNSKLRRALPGMRDTKLYEPPAVKVGNVSKVERILECRTQSQQLRKQFSLTH